MRRTLFLITVVILLIFGGFMSYAISRQGPAAVPMIKVQTNNPEANVFTVTTDKGAYFFLFVAIALGSVIGMGATLALVFRLLNRQVEIVNHKPDEPSKLLVMLSRLLHRERGDDLLLHPPDSITVEKPGSARKA